MAAVAEATGVTAEVMGASSAKLAALTEIRRVVKSVVKNSETRFFIKNFLE
jgi:hypothetical protein